MVERRQMPFERDDTEIFDININRIKQNSFLKPRSHGFDRIEYRRHIHKKHCENIVKVGYIPKKHKQRRKDESYADIEYDQA